MQGVQFLTAVIEAGVGALLSFLNCLQAQSCPVSLSLEAIYTPGSREAL